VTADQYIKTHKHQSCKTHLQQNSCDNCYQ